MTTEMATVGLPPEQLYQGIVVGSTRFNHNKVDKISVHWWSSWCSIGRYIMVFHCLVYPCSIVDRHGGPLLVAVLVVVMVFHWSHCCSIGGGWWSSRVLAFCYI